MGVMERGPKKIKAGALGFGGLTFLETDDGGFNEPLKGGTPSKGNA